MTTQKYPSREVFLNILAAAGWGYDTNQYGTSFLVSPEGYKHLIPKEEGKSAHRTAWDYYLTIVSFDKLPT